MAAAAPQNRRKNHKTRRSCCFFGGCFGISNKISADHATVHRKLSLKNGNTHHVPVNDQSICSSREIHVVEEDRNTQLNPAEPKRIGHNKTHDVISEKGKIWDHESGRAASSIKQVEFNKTSTTMLSHSLSLPPPPKREKPPARDGGAHKGKDGKELIPAAGDFDSIFGALIIMVTLIVMLIWGKVCAILCTAAWFYLIPLVTENINQSNASKLKNGTNHVDLDSREYKKKVVLQGLLERNQHVSL